MRSWLEITYVDELLADGSVHRRYSDGRQEWRTRGAAGVVNWRDDRGVQGTDEPLGRRMIKRTHGDGTVRYGRDIGFGRTVWGEGILAVNRSSFGGRIAAILATVGMGAALANVELPPQSLTPEEEEELRNEAQAQLARQQTGEYSYEFGPTDHDDDFG